MPDTFGQLGSKEKKLWLRAKEFAAEWIARRQGSPSDLIRDMEIEVGWPIRHLVLGVLADLRDEQDLSREQRKYLTYTLNDASVKEALAEGNDPSAEYQSSLDDLFTRSRAFRSSKKFAEAIEFVAKFREYSAYNNMLVYLQNPLANHYATANHWRKQFGRTIKPEARGMMILAPKTPVLIVYDIADTIGPPLPDQFEIFSKTRGKFNPSLLEHLLANCARQKILVERMPMSRMRGGFATARVEDKKFKMRIALREDLDEAAAYSVLCHEIAHIFLGHVGTDKDKTWPYRLNLPHAVMEIEAEAVAHIIACRAGLKTYSAEYLSSFVDEDAELTSISLDLVCRVAKKIEDMSTKLLAVKEDELG